MKALNNRYNFLFYGFLILGILGLSACAKKTAQKTAQYYLGNSSFKGNKVIKSGELETLIPQKPNRRFLGLPFFPYVGLYHFGELFYNKEEHQLRLIEVTQKYRNALQIHENNPQKLSKIGRKYEKKISKVQSKIDDGNFWMRVVGEKPVYFHENEVSNNALKIQKYLYNNGFFKAQVDFKTDTIVNRVKIQYLVDENIPTNIRRISYKIANHNMDSIVRSQVKESFLHAGKRYDGDSFENERIRIETLLRNHGYFGFSRQNIAYLVNDTIHIPETDSIFKPVDVLVRVDVSNNGKPIVPYTVQSVQFEVLPPSGLPDSLFKKDTSYFEGVQYIFSDKKFSEKILNNKILVKPNTVYSQQNERDTQQQLSLTDQFRFVNYGYKLDSTNNALHSYFKAIPLEKYQISTDVGLNVIQLQGAPGPFANLSYKVRNVFKGLENFESNIRGGIELVPGFLGSKQKQIYKSEEIGINTSLNFPRLLTPGQLFQKKLSLLNPRTQIGVGYNYVNRPEYTRSIVKASLNYSWQPSKVTIFNLSLLDLNILNTQKLRPDFQQLLDTLQLQGNNLINSFQKSFVSDINFNFVYNTNPFSGPPVNAKYLRVAFESGGTSLNLIPSQQKLIQNIFGELQFYKYLRWNIDYRKYWPTGKKSVLVARVNTGSVYSYGDNKVPPYEKYFFAGGSNSLRAWLPRRLGPGSSPPRLTSNNLSVEAPGEFLLEGNLEYRGYLTHFFGDINYALFLDAGNVWNTTNNSSEAQRLRAKNLFKDIALGTGFGVRYDVSYFVLRVDFGIKVYDPAVQKLVLDELNFKKLFNRTQPNFLNVNLGVGYPF